MSGAVEVLYRDDAIVVVNKPPGLLIHRSEIDRHETDFLVQRLRDALDGYVYPVHRLDKATSGVMVFALTQPAAAALAAAWRSGAVGKTYLAVVRGYIECGGCIDHALKPRRRDQRYDSRSPPATAALDAVTRYAPLARVEIQQAVGRYPTARYSLVSLEPVTGRRHQLRRHMKHIFHPIVGDTTYGDSRHNRWFRDVLGCRRLLLAAYRLRFPHPVTGLPQDFTALPQDSFAAVIERFSWNGSLPGGSRVS